MKDLVLRSSADPLITVVDLPHQANAVFNAGAADLGEDVLLLLRVEARFGGLTRLGVQPSTRASVA